MIIFLSYSSDRRDIAEQVNLALIGSGHKVFFDRDSLPAGDDYHIRIRKGVENSEVFVFLISPKSVALGSYSLTELKYARQKWPDPRQRVLPVMIERTEYQQMPNYLKVVTVLEPEGNVPAEVVAELERWNAHAQGILDSRSASTPRQEEVGRGKTVSDSRGAGQLGRRVASGIVGAFGAVMVFMSVVDAGVAGISEGGLLIGALALGSAYGLWPRGK
ncbi:MAG: toll/interleukin-1 receptor domain-containing protein [Acidobacteria bacterium]|nr:toll/interleukin-1 receptor domain-containing protein [Acidobacteriota bacterium]MCI0723580.1 toll/interleukin-1 receptor domain-containing protein [Acidobacteriota bacterium]